MSRRYILGTDERSWGVWDRRAGDEPIERFPLTDEGLEAAEARFRELRKQDRRSRIALPKLLWAVTAIGVGIWVISSIFQVAMGWGYFPWLWNLDLAWILGDLGYQMAAGGLILLAGLVLLRWERRTRPPADAAREKEPPPGRFDRLAWRVMAGGILAWVVAGLATSWTTREVFGEPPPLEAEAPFLPIPPGLEAEGISIAELAPFLAAPQLPPEPLALRIARGTETIAFRLWVAALILLGVGLARRWGRQDPTARSDPEP